MGRLTINPNKYANKSDVINAVYYDLNINKCTRCLCHANLIIGHNPFSPDSVASQLLAIQNASPLRFERRIYHVGYDLDYALDPVSRKTIYSVGICLLSMYPGYQSIFAVHENTKHLHLHLIYNNVPFYGTQTLSHIINAAEMEYKADQVISFCWNRINQNRLSSYNPIHVMSHIQ